MIEQIADLYRARARDGLEINQAIVELHEKGLTIIQSMQVLIEAYGLSLPEAKVKVSGHPVWSDVVSASKPLHDELVKELKQGEPR